MQDVLLHNPFIWTLLFAKYELRRNMRISGAAIGPDAQLLWSCGPFLAAASPRSSCRALQGRQRPDRPHDLCLPFVCSECPCVLPRLVVLAHLEKEFYYTHRASSYALLSFSCTRDHSRP